MFCLPLCSGNILRNSQNQTICSSFRHENRMLKTTKIAWRKRKENHTNHTKRGIESEREIERMSEWEYKCRRHITIFTTENSRKSCLENAKSKQKLNNKFYGLTQNGCTSREYFVDMKRWNEQRGREQTRERERWHFQPLR